MTRLPEPADVNRHDDNQVTVTIDVTENLVFFPGHFPGRPVLPGVVMLDWVIELAQRYLPVDVQFAGMNAVKFRQMVRPPLRIYLHIHYRPDLGKLVYRVYSDGAEHSSGKISQVTGR